MKTLLFLFFAGYTVRCDDSYYVVRAPENTKTKEFNVYWNVPTMQCKSKKIPFEDLYEKYGIIQNTNDTHRGDRISIMYDPGNFPALITDEKTGELKYRNGGVPQEGDMMDHLQIFKRNMNDMIADENFDGVGIIDFESWRPILRQNFGTLTPYKDVSYDIEKARHWWWKKQWIQDEAKRRFEEAGREFMQTTLALAKKLRPKALWGYYGYPQCFNRAANSNPEKCANDMPPENDETNWLWSESTALYPSVYSTKDMTKKQLIGFISGRIKESARVRQKGTPILPYWWYRYRDGGFFTQGDLDASFSTFYKSDATGFIIWGSSNDVNTTEKCEKLKEYVTNILGPTILKYTKPNKKTGVMFDEINTTTEDTESITGLYEVPDINQEYNGPLSKNCTQSIQQIVDEEFSKDGETKHNKTSLLTLLLHKIATYCSEHCYKRMNPDIISNVLTTRDPFKKSINNYESNVTEDDGYIYRSTVYGIDKSESANYGTTSGLNTAATIKVETDEKLSQDNVFQEIKLSSNDTGNDNNKSSDNFKFDNANINKDYYTDIMNTADADEQNSTTTTEDKADSSTLSDKNTTNPSAGPVLTEQVVISVD